MSVAPAALAALFMGVAGAAQHHATHQVARRPALHPGLVLALVRRPWWVLGGLCSLVGLGLQAGALAVGSIVVVQTVVISSLGWAAVAESLFARRLPARHVVVGVGLAAAGVVGFLLAAAPRVPPDVPTPTPLAAGVVVAGCLALGTAGLAWGLRRASRFRGLGLALATGVAYGLTAALLKLVLAQGRHGGWAAPLHHPALYALVLVGPAAVLLSQNTLQHGRPAAPVLAVVVLVDPLVGAVTGVLWFGERLATGPGALAVAAAGLAAAVAGVALSQAPSGDARRGTRAGRWGGGATSRRRRTSLLLRGGRRKRPEVLELVRSADRR